MVDLPQYGSVFPDDVLARLRDLEAAVNDLQAGTFQAVVTLDGDVTGQSSTTVVEAVQGQQVAATTPSSGQVLEWDGTAWTATTPDSVPDWNLFGDGFDGDATISTTVTLTQDKFYDDLTVSSTGVLKAGGYRIYVKGTLTVESGGIVQHDGTTATTRIGGSGASGGSDGSVFDGGDGANGGDFNAGSSANTSTGNWGGGNGGNGGSSGGSGSNVGGNGATLTPQTTRRLRSTHSIMHARSFQTGYGTYTAGGGGGGGAGPSASVGGGGGGGGGVLHICAKTLVNDGTIRALGGNGAPGQSGNGSGGGGGGGGVVLLSYKTKSGSGTVSVAGGTGGTGVGTGGNGTDGTAGTIYELALT